MKASTSSLIRSGVDRRMFGKLLAGTGAYLTSRLLGPRRARAGNQPIFYTWEGYEDPGFFADYVEESGGLPILQTFTDENEALQNLSAGMQVDVAHPCADTVQHWRKAGILQPIDTSRLSNWPDLIEPLRHIPGTATDGTQWLVPVDWGTTSVIYRTDLVDIEEESYRLLWDERYAGKLALGEDVTESVIMAALACGISDPFNMSDQDLSTVRQALAAQRGLLKYYWSDLTIVQQGLKSGELVASSGWSDIYLTLKKEGVPVKFMNPKEGIMSWCCGLALMETATEIDEAYELVNALIGPNAGQWLAGIGIAHSNRKTFERAGHNLLADLGLPTDPAELLASSVFLHESPRLADYQRMFDDVRGLS
jgi:spermidine/putrescine transport system substrate-binding protein